MRAIRFVGPGQPAELTEVGKPTPGPGQVLVKIAGAGVCHSDLHILDHDMGLKPPFTLGHENAGHIAALGQGVTQWKEGDAVAIYGPWGCGRCETCQTSAENYCENHASLATMGGGLGSDGGMSEFMLVPSPRLLVPLGRLDPVNAAPLSDAALTPYHAIKAAMPMLTPEASVLVIGVGGLGHMAVQILWAMSAARLIAADIDDAKLELALEHGAQHTVNTRDPDAAAEKIAALVGPRGVTVVLDFVGAQSTIDLGVRVVGRNSRLTVVGLAGGTIHYTANNPPYGCEVSIPYWGSRVELMEVIALAEAGKIRVDVETFPLDQGVQVYQRLREGKIRGRAVLRP